MPYYVLFDTETTGNQEDDRIIQVGAMIVKSKNDIEVYNEMCNAPVPIKIDAMEVHGITSEQIEGLGVYGDTEFARRLDEINSGENYLIAHNISFDLSMIQKEGFENRMQLIDTVRCAKHLLPDMPAHRLQYLRYALGLYKDEAQEAEKLGITIKAHDAIGDVLILKLLFSHLIDMIRQKHPDLNPVEKMVELTQTPVMIKTFRFGKYKGESIADVVSRDASYIKWMRKNLELDEDLTYTLDYYMENL